MGLGLDKDKLKNKIVDGLKKSLKIQAPDGTDDKNREFAEVIANAVHEYIKDAKVEISIMIKPGDLNQSGIGVVVGPVPGSVVTPTPMIPTKVENMFGELK